MSDTIICPKCRYEIEVTEVLSAQLRSQLQKEFEADFRAKEADIAAREQAIAAAKGEVARAKQEIDQRVADQLEKERKTLSENALLKARKQVPKDVAEIMAAYLAGRDQRTMIWPRSWWRRSAEMLRDDLVDAGIKPVDDDGRVVDFHGQRVTFITGLARVGVVPASSTMKYYVHLEAADLSAALKGWQVNPLVNPRPAEPHSTPSAEAPRN